MALARTYKIGILIGITALVLTAGGAIAYASIPAPNGTIDGCYKTSGPAQGALIIIDSTATCPSGPPALHRNQPTHHVTPESLRPRPNPHGHDRSRHRLPP